ncbi:MAG: hypothetical protein AAFV54_01215, partial [Pseudomonadota bacterium]
MPVTASDFEDLGETDEPEDEKEDSKEDEEEVHDWLADLLVDNQGICKPAFHNVRLILSNDPRVAPCIALNEFTREVVRVKPFREGKKNKLGLIRQKVRNPKDGDLWSGVDYGNLQSLLSAGQNCGGYQFEIGRDKLRDA